MPKFTEGVLETEDFDHPYIKIFNSLSRERKEKGASDHYATEEEMEILKFDSPFMTCDTHTVSQNPNFYQCVTMDIEIIKDKLVPPPTIIILLKHQRYNRQKKSETVLLGRYWMSLETEKNVNLKDKESGHMLNFVFQRPSWIPMIYDKKEKIDGKVLVSYTLVELDETVMDLRNTKRVHTYRNPELFATAVNHGYIRNFSNEEYYPLMAEYHMWPESNVQKLNIFMMGFRDVRLGKKMPEMSCIVRIHGVVDKYEQGFKKLNEGEQLATEANPKTEEPNKPEKGKIARLNRDRNHLEEGQESEELEFALDEDLSTITVNRILNVDVQVPNVVELAPIMEVFLFQGKGANKRLLSTGSLDMRRAFAYYYGIEDNIDYKERLMNFMKMRAVGSGGAGDLKPDVKVKIPRVKAQNKMNYFGINYVVEMPDIKKAMEKEAGVEFEKKKEGENIRKSEGMVPHLKDDFGDDQEQGSRNQSKVTPIPEEEADDEHEDEQIEEMKETANLLPAKKSSRKQFKEDNTFAKKIAKKAQKKKLDERFLGDEDEQLLQKNNHLKYQVKKFKNRSKAESEDERKEWEKYLLQVPLAREPGKKWVYADLNAALIGAIIEERSGMSLRDFAQQKVFGPLDIQEFYWYTNAANQTVAAGNLYQSALDFAKLGLLVANRGKWGDKQLADPDYMDRLLHENSAAIGDYNPLADGYGLFWYRSTRNFGKREISYLWASGNGGNHLVIVPEEHLVVAMTAGAYGNWFPHTRAYFILGKVIQALKSER